MIKIQQLSCLKSQDIILKNINLEIKQGEKVAIIGPSGAGKTTLFKILSKTEEDYEGQIYLNHQNITQYTHNKSFARVVGIISQGIHLIDNLKVYYNVAIGKFSEWSFIQSLKLIFKKDDEVKKAVESVQMSNHLNKKTGHLSGGEKQRIAIARLIVQNPKIVLADEPIAALDPKLAKDILELLLSKTKRQTMLMILHHTSFATKYFDRVIALKQGQVYFDLPASQVTEDMLGALYE